MKPSIDISSDFSFYLLLGFLLLIPFSIAACYILFTFLLIQLIFFSVKAFKQPKEPADAPHRFPHMPRYYKYFLFYILATLVSTLFSIDQLHSFKDNKEIFGYLLIPLFLVMIHSEKRLRHTLTAVLASAVASSLLGIGQALISGVSLDHRLQGATSHWMTYSGLLMFSFIFFFVLLFHENQKKRKMIIAFSLVVILSAILLSLTRTVWVGIAVSLAIFIVYYKPKILYLAIPALVLLVLVMPPSVKTRVTSIFDLQNATNKDRLYMAQIAFSIFKDYPVTGVGPNNIEKVYERYKPAGADLSNMH
ncbi:MAG: O-antigen ligase family protein, partial [bacterium]|nr:O-antigen ligase family protein [bacterium]